MRTDLSAHVDWFESERTQYCLRVSIKKSLDIRVADAKASQELDRVPILNSIRGSTGAAINDKPPATHELYTAVDDALKATFASSVQTLHAASEGGL